MQMNLLKTTAVLFLAVSAGALFGAELNNWKFSSENDLKNVHLYVNKKNDAELIKNFDPEMKPSDLYQGSCCLEVVKHGKIFADLTAHFTTKHDIKKGKHYTISLMMRADRNLNIRLMVSKNYPNWASAFTYPCRLTAGRWQKVTFQFDPKFDLPGKHTSRAPVILFGDMPTGTKLWIASASLSDEE